ncbi:hypothetical protein FQA39_LY07932 [Lamprigera yunnana]|nr:hypothetical protein FQA39_LY07932 [Lamprigera yunnana]
MPETRSVNKSKDRDDQLVQRAIEKTLKNKDFMHQIVTTVTELVKQQFQSIIIDLQTKVASLERQISAKIDAIEHLRLNNLRIFGIIEGEQKSENTNDTIINFCKNHLNICLEINDIDYSHRLLEKKNVKQLIFNNKKPLKGKKIIIREDLTKTRLQLIASVKEKYQFEGAIHKFEKYDDLISVN